MLNKFLISTMIAFIMRLFIITNDMEMNQTIVITETTQASILHYWVGVSNIWARDLPNLKGVIASRLSANVTIFDLNTKKDHNQKVFTGSVLLLDTQKYQIVDVTESNGSTLGSITLQKIL